MKQPSQVGSSGAPQRSNPFRALLASSRNSEIPSGPQKTSTPTPRVNRDFMMQRPLASNCRASPCIEPCTHGTCQTTLPRSLSSRSRPCGRPCASKNFSDVRRPARFQDTCASRTPERWISPRIEMPRRSVAEIVTPRGARSGRCSLSFDALNACGFRIGSRYHGSHWCRCSCNAVDIRRSESTPLPRAWRFRNR
jgi:hypothetical protein